MDEPIQAHESQFWDQVAAWILDGLDRAHEGISPAEHRDTGPRKSDDGQEYL
ncbi:MAG TPA: hypothetical protein VLI46_02825 [Ramlibacter sp.]|nr:hypothetical protein [Ramlibacter sp.]